MQETKTNFVMQDIHDYQKKFKSPDFHALLIRAVSSSTFGSIKFQIPNTYDTLTLSVMELHSVVDGERLPFVLEVSYNVAKNVSQGKKPNIFSSNGEQTFKPCDVEEAVKCFLNRCVAEQPRLKFPSVKDINPIR